MVHRLISLEFELGPHQRMRLSLFFFLPLAGPHFKTNRHLGTEGLLTLDRRFPRLPPHAHPLPDHEVIGPLDPDPMEHVSERQINGARQLKGVPAPQDLRIVKFQVGRKSLKLKNGLIKIEFVEGAFFNRKVAFDVGPV